MAASLLPPAPASPAPARRGRATEGGHRRTPPGLPRERVLDPRGAAACRGHRGRSRTVPSTTLSRDPVIERGRQEKGGRGTPRGLPARARATMCPFRIHRLQEDPALTPGQASADQQPRAAVASSGALLTATSITGPPSRQPLPSSSSAECHWWSSIQLFEGTKQGVRSDNGMRGDPGPDRLGGEVHHLPAAGLRSGRT